MVRVVAITAFDYAGARVESGTTLDVGPLDAAMLVYRGRVQFSRTASPQADSEEPKFRRRYKRRDLTSEEP